MKVIITILIVTALAGGCYWLTRYLTKDQDTTVGSDLISINVLCNGEKQCVYQGQDLNINIIITNISNDSISLPVAYLGQLGPRITLINNDTGKELIIPTGPSQQSLLDDRTVISPGQTARLSWILKNSDILQVAGDAINILANVTLSTPVYNSTGSTQETGRSSFTITH